LREELGTFLSSCHEFSLGHAELLSGAGNVSVESARVLREKPRFLDQRFKKVTPA
jgi:DNA-nicking Smr family endonuclease